MSKKTATRIESVEGRLYRMSNGQELSESEKNLMRFAWAEDVLYLPGMIVGASEPIMLLGVAYEGVKHFFEDGMLFVPANWLEENFPQLRHPIKTIRECAEGVRFQEQD